MISEPTKIKLADRDLYVMQMDSQIEAKKKMLLEKKKSLDEESKENEYLDVVKKDYQKYYDYIVKQKENELKMMDTLTNHIDEIIKSTKLSKEEIQKRNKDRNEVLDEIKKLKQGLDDLIKKTNIGNIGNNNNSNSNNSNNNNNSNTNLNVQFKTNPNIIPSIKDITGQSNLISSSSNNGKKHSSSVLGLNQKNTYTNPVVTGYLRDKGCCD